MNNVVGVRVLSGFILGMDFLPVLVDLENPTGGGNEGKFIDGLFELDQNLFRQTDGVVLVASGGAVFQLDVHSNYLLKVFLIQFDSEFFNLE